MLFSRVKSIRRKLRLMIVITSGISMLLACGVWVFFAREWFDKSMMRRIETLAQMTSFASQTPLDFDDAKNGQLFMDCLKSSPEIVMGRLYRTNGTLFAEYLRPGFAVKTYPDPLKKGYDAKKLIYVMPVHNVVGENVGTLCLQADTHIAVSFFWQCLIVAAVAFELAFLAAAFLAGRFQASISEPISELLKTMTTVSKERNYALRARRGADDELGNLVDEFNEMLLQIQTRDQALQEQREHLEETVAQRTEELTRAYRKMIESYDQLKKLESLRDGLTHMLAHDMRSPLLGMSQMIETLELTSSEHFNEEDCQTIKYLQVGCKRLTGMIDSLLDVSRLENREMPLQLRVCDLQSLCHSAIEPLRPLLENRRLNVSACDEPVQAMCDKDLIERVISNLVDNAIKWTSGNGLIEIRIESADDGLKISVADNGCGVPPAFHQKIFEKFAQVEGGRKWPHSTGLGLAFCKLAIEAHGGRIGIESEPGKGSVFWLSLPPYTSSRKTLSAPEMHTVS